MYVNPPELLYVVDVADNVIVPSYLCQLFLCMCNIKLAYKQNDDGSIEISIMESSYGEISAIQNWWSFTHSGWDLICRAVPRQRAAIHIDTPWT